MKKGLFQGKIYIKKTRSRGYGVFADQTFKKGQLIEECYVILTRGWDKGLEDYYFDAKKRRNAIFTGCGIIYNHADDPNADYTISTTRRIATIKAERTIHKGEEIFISYGDKWFASRGRTAK